MDLADNNDVAIQPFPLRYWWLKRLALAYVGLMLLAVGVRVWWGYSARHRLDALIAQYRAAGEPVLVEDFVVPAVPDELNAAHYYLQAYGSIHLNKDNEPFYDAMTPSAMAAAGMDQFMDANRPIFDLLRRARPFDQHNWGVGWASPTINTVLPHLNSVRLLISLLSNKVIYDHQRHEDHDAVETLRDMVHLADSLDNSPFLISSLVQVGVHAQIDSTLRQVMDDLQIGESGKSATREQVQALIAELLNESAQRRGLRVGMTSERASMIDTVENVAEGKLWLNSIIAPPTPLQSNLQRLLAPMFREDALGGLHAFEGYVRATTLPDNPSVKFPAMPFAPSAQSWLIHIFSAMTYPNYSRIPFTYFREINDRRTAASLLAGRLYEVDHGHLPRAIEDLVPDYLPAVPLDALAGHGATIAPFHPDPATTRSN